MPWPSKQVCEIEGCGRMFMAKGLCRTHYSRLRKGLDLNAPVRAKNKYLWSPWRFDRHGYLYRTRQAGPGGKIVREIQHREVMKEKLGRDLLPGENVHHINGVRHDNRPENLELWVTKQPKGQRPEDLVEYAKEILRIYGEGEPCSLCK